MMLMSFAESLGRWFVGRAGTAGHCRPGMGVQPPVLLSPAPGISRWLPKGHPQAPLPHGVPKAVWPW